MSPLGLWKPKRFERFEQSFDTSVGTSIVVTDAGKAYLKPLGNRQGPHVLACEWVATQLADWLGLATFDYALLVLAKDDEIPLKRGKNAGPGSAFVTRAENGHPWGGDVETLKGLANNEDISRLVVFDTWTRNCDRHPPTSARRPNLDNVFLARQEAGVKLIAMDHTHCFTCGRDLDEHVADIDKVQDPKIYGLFPAFVPLMNKDVVEATCEKLNSLEPKHVNAIVESIPDEWEVSPSARHALESLVVQRASFVADTVVNALSVSCWPPEPQDLFKEQEP